MMVALLCRRKRRAQTMGKPRTSLDMVRGLRAADIGRRPLHAPQILEVVTEGEIVPSDRGDLTVKPKCETNCGFWYCTSHPTEHLANQLQKDIHITHGTHRLAWCCWEHGIEVP